MPPDGSLLDRLDAILAKASRLAGAADIPRAAILFLSTGKPANRGVLLCEDENGTFGLPGAAVQDGETAEHAARRGAAELIGFSYDAPLSPLGDCAGVTTFLARLDSEFEDPPNTWWANINFVLGFSPTGDPTPYAIEMHKRLISMGINDAPPKRTLPILQPAARAAIEALGDALPILEQPVNAYGDSAMSASSAAEIAKLRKQLNDLERRATPISDVRNGQDVSASELAELQRAQAAGRFKAGESRTVYASDGTGRKIAHFFGDEVAAWKPFTNPEKRGRIAKP
jgi:ADP-ribose pyrophosphatase YjhB (NUDIX family)